MVAGNSIEFVIELRTLHENKRYSRWHPVEEIELELSEKVESDKVEVFRYGKKGTYIIRLTATKANP